jgi:hypothetical protein
MRKNLIVASLLVTSVLFARKNFQKNKDSIEVTVIITTDAIIGVNSTPKTKQVLLFYISN